MPFASKMKIFHLIFATFWYYVIPFHKIFLILQECFRMKSRLSSDDAVNPQDIFAQILSPNQHLEREPTGKNHVTIGAAHKRRFHP